MTNSDDSINSIMVNSRYVVGLTKREYFAALAMQGVLANPLLPITLEYPNSIDFVVVQSVGIADALIDELNKK